MLTTLFLATAERLINTALNTDPISQSELALLTGKRLRVAIGSPNLTLDVLFCGDTVQFLPVVSDVFEPQGGITTRPDCTVSVSTPKELMDALKNPPANPPISGDERLWTDVCYVVGQFEPTVFSEMLLHLTDGKPLHKKDFLANFNELKLLISPLQGFFQKDDGINTELAQKQTELDELQAQIAIAKQELHDLHRQKDRLRNQSPFSPKNQTQT